MCTSPYFRKTSPISLTPSFQFLYLFLCQQGIDIAIPLVGESCLLAKIVRTLFSKAGLIPPTSWRRRVMKSSPKRAVRSPETIDLQYPDGRIAHAMYLMQTSDLSVTQIAYEVGFVEMLTFAREFKKHTLMTPKEFKTSLHKKQARRMNLQP